MQTVNFNCSFCEKMMAVGLNLLGRNVRCPHCKQVVQAPAAGGAAAPAAPKQRTPPRDLQSFQSPGKPITSNESIFSETANNEMFGRGHSELNLSDIQSPALPESLASTNEAGADYDLGVNEPFNNLVPPKNVAPGQPSRGKAAPETRSESELQNATPNTGDQLPPEAFRASGGGPFIWMLLIYSAITTAIAAYLFYERTQQATGP